MPAVGEAVEVLVGRVVGVADVPHDLLLEGEVSLDKGIDLAQGRNDFAGRDIVGELAQQVIDDPDQVLLVVVDGPDAGLERVPPLNQRHGIPPFLNLPRRQLSVIEDLPLIHESLSPIGRARRAANSTGAKDAR